MSNNWISLIFLGGWGAPQPGWPCMSFSIKGAIKLIIACAHPFFNDFCKIPQKIANIFRAFKKGRKGKKRKDWLLRRPSRPRARARARGEQRRGSLPVVASLYYLFLKIFDENLLKFGENLVKIWWKFGPISSVSSAFWILSLISSRIWCYLAVWERKKSKFVKKRSEIFLNENRDFFGFCDLISAKFWIFSSSSLRACF